MRFDTHPLCTYTILYSPQPPQAQPGLSESPRARLWAGLCVHCVPCGARPRVVREPKCRTEAVDCRCGDKHLFHFIRECVQPSRVSSDVCRLVPMPPGIIYILLQLSVIITFSRCESISGTSPRRLRATRPSPVIRERIALVSHWICARAASNYTTAPLGSAYSLHRSIGHPHCSGASAQTGQGHVRNERWPLCLGGVVVERCRLGACRLGACRLERSQCGPGRGRLRGTCGCRPAVRGSCQLLSSLARCALSRGRRPRAPTLLVVAIPHSVDLFLALPLALRAHTPLLPRRLQLLALLGYELACRRPALS